MESTRIKEVIIEPVNIALDEPFTISIGTKYNIENALITLRLENGMEGYGEASPLEPINGENQSTALATLNSCREYLIGLDVSDFRKISKHLKSVFWAQVTARCAIEMAMLDAYTKSLKIPLFKYFGGATNHIVTDYTVDIVTSVAANSNASRLARKGYRTLKAKVGKNINEDVERILAIREGAPNCGITIDANQGYSPYEAVQFIKELEKHNMRPLLFEQPVIRHDLAGMKYVKDNTSVPVAADESVFTTADAMNIIRMGCADIINVKIMKSGIIEALDIITLARCSNIRLMIGCMLETKLALGCSVHIAGGTGEFSFIDLDPHVNPEAEPFSGGPKFKDPAYTLSDEDAGIGVYRKKIRNQEK
jgi:L-Ala-D/L-Glu epimerase